jgi:hypothetical protein
MAGSSRKPTNRRANALAKERAMLARLHEVGSRLWLKRDLRRALDEILEGAIELLGAEMGIIRILDSARGVLKIEAHRGFNQDFLNSFSEVSAVQSPFALAEACLRLIALGKQGGQDEGENGDRGCRQLGTLDALHERDTCVAKPTYAERWARITATDATCSAYPESRLAAGRQP